jgi:hypothetical protein
MHPPTLISLSSVVSLQPSAEDLQDNFTSFTLRILKAQIFVFSEHMNKNLKIKIVMNIKEKMYRKEKEDTLGPGMKINNLFYLLKR